MPILDSNLLWLCVCFSQSKLNWLFPYVLFWSLGVLFSEIYFLVLMLLTWNLQTLVSQRFFFFLKLDFGLDLILDLDLDLSLDLDLDFGLFFADEVFLACVLGLDLPGFWSLLPTEVDVDVALIFGFFPIFMLFFHLMKDFFGIFEHASKLRNMK